LETVNECGAARRYNCL